MNDSRLPFFDTLEIEMDTAEEAGRVCIVGAGSSGIAACKVLRQHGIPFDCFEAGDRVGGNWVYDNSNGMSSAYRSLHINTSKPRMQYSDFPMPAEYPDFPHHSQIARYFDDFVDHFGVRLNIRFGTLVTRCEPAPQGGWDVTIGDGSTMRYRALLIANGHHWDQRWPQPPFPGEFQGRILHSHCYKTPEEFAGQNVVVVGFGNSAVDIAVELSRTTAEPIMAVRRGFHVVPKHIFGNPLDQQAMPKWLPFGLQRSILQAMLRIQVGKVTDFGLPQPDHKLLHAHPTISSELLNSIAHGRIKIKPNIERLDGDAVVFKDGSREPADSIIYCTGYKVTFPFFRPELIAASDNDLPLFKRVLHPRRRDLFFIGLLQPLGAIMPLAELQSEWVSRYLKGEYAPPSGPEMERDIARERDVMRRRYGDTPRHTMQVDFDPYVDAVRKEMKRGAKRAAKLKAAAG